MITSTLAGLACYYILLFVVGFLVNAAAIEGALVSLAGVGFVGAYIGRSSPFVRHMGYWIGGIATVLVLAVWIILPVIQSTGNTWLVIISTVVAVIVFIISRSALHRRWLHRNRETGNRPAPPFNREWCRWIIAFVL